MDDLTNGLGRHGSLVGTAECRRDVAPNADASLPGPSDDGPESLDGLVHPRIDVVAVERLRSGREHGDLQHAGLQRALEALEVGNQRGIPHAARAVNPGKHLLGFRQLRNRLFRNERADLDRGQTRLGQTIDETDFRIRRERLGLVLQTIARTDFVNDGVLGQVRTPNRVVLPGIHGEYAISYQRSTDAGRHSGDLGQRRSRLDQVPFAVREAAHDAVPGRTDRVLHLHGLQDHQHLAARDGRAFRDVHAPQQAWHRSEQVAGGLAGPGGRRSRLELERPSCAPDANAASVAKSANGVNAIADFDRAELPSRPGSRETAPRGRRETPAPLPSARLWRSRRRKASLPGPPARGRIPGLDPSRRSPAPLDVRKSERRRDPGRVGNLGIRLRKTGDEVGRVLAGKKILRFEHRLQQRQIRLDAQDHPLRKRPLGALDRRASIRAQNDELGQQGIVLEAHDAALPDSRVHADAGAHGLLECQEAAASGRNETGSSA